MLCDKNCDVCHKNVNLTSTARNFATCMRKRDEISRFQPVVVAKSREIPIHHKTQDICLKISRVLQDAWILSDTKSPKNSRFSTSAGKFSSAKQCSNINVPHLHEKLCEIRKIATPKPWKNVFFIWNTPYSSTKNFKSSWKQQKVWEPTKISYFQPFLNPFTLLKKRKIHFCVENPANAFFWKLRRLFPVLWGTEESRKDF